MTWTYDGLPSTSSTAGLRDFVRVLVKDTSTVTSYVTDESISAFLGINGNSIFRTAADVCDALSAGHAQRKQVGDLSIDGLAQTYRDLARRYRFRADATAIPYAGGISVADKQATSQDTDRVKPAFDRTMQTAIPFPPVTGSTQASVI